MNLLARGQEYAIATPKLQSLDEKIMVLPEGSPALSSVAALSRTDFVPLEAISDSLKGLVNYWLKIPLSNQISEATGEREWVLRFSLSVSRAEVFLFRQDTFSPVRLAGFFVPVDQRAFAPTLKANLIKFDLPPGEGVTLLATVVAAENEDHPLVLIIEDNVDVITYIQTCLKDKFQVRTALNGRLGMEAAFREIPDIIISDVMMPEMNGYEVCQSLKQDIRTSHIPIILLTAKADKQGRLTGLKRGADAYLTKPFDKDELLTRIDQLIELRENLQKYFLRTSLLNQVKEVEPETEEASFLKTLQDTVLKNIDRSELNVNDLCKEVTLGHTQLYRKLKALTGLTPLQFIKTIRFDRATQLLSAQQMSISEIAYAVGFNDPNYFSRAFQQHFGYPPRDYPDRESKVSGQEKSNTLES